MHIAICEDMPMRIGICRSIYFLKKPLVFLQAVFWFAIYSSGTLSPNKIRI